MSFQFDFATGFGNGIHRILKQIQGDLLDLIWKGRHFWKNLAVVGFEADVSVR